MTAEEKLKDWQTRALPALKGFRYLLMQMHGRCKTKEESDRIVQDLTTLDKLITEAQP